jgi:plasmid rolling circle replication initiator protein Rep
VSDNAETWKNKTAQKWTDKKIKALEISEKMKAADMKGRAGRMADCGNEFEYQYCNDCKKWQISRATLCRDRLCPICKWRLSVKRYCLMLPVMQELTETHGDKKYSFITLTVQNCKVGDIRETVKKMANMWHKIIRRRTIRREIAGFARSFEITYNHKRKDFHPHFHIIAVWNGSPCHAEVIDAWLDLARKEGLVADIKAQDGKEIMTAAVGTEAAEQDITKAVLETYKYETKDKDLEEMNIMQFKEFAVQMSGLRSAALGGIIKEIAKVQGVTETQLESSADNEEMRACSDCGSIELTRAAAVWAGTGYKWL